MTFTRVGRLVQRVAAGWKRHRIPSRAAALAFYALFAAAPLLVIAVAVAGFAFGRAAAEGELLTRIEGHVGRPAAETLQGVLRHMARPRAGLAASAAGLALLLLGASGFFLQLQEDLNAIWGTRPGVRTPLAVTLRRRVTAFLMVLGVGFVLLASLLAGAALQAAERLLPGEPGARAGLLKAADLAGSFAATGLLFAVVYRVLPETPVRWRDAVAGGLAAAALFTLGKYAIAFYLARSTLASAYGAAGSLVAILVWVYYSTQIFLMGAEIARASGTTARRRRRSPLKRAAA